MNYQPSTYETFLPSMPPPLSPVLVLGCGVSGLSCGIRLMEEGFQATIIARERTPHTTSDVAAAVFFPYRVYPHHRVLGWGKVAFPVFKKLASVPDSGVILRKFVDLFPVLTPDAWWGGMMEDYRRAEKGELVCEYPDGVVFTTAVVEMPAYLKYLERWFESLGGIIESGHVSSLEAMSQRCSLIVNCTGLGARELTGDPEAFPIKGQVVRVPNRGLERVLEDYSGSRALAYVVPRRNDVVLGGIALDGFGDREYDPAVEEEILRKCEEIEPGLKGLVPVSRAVGLRPGRREVRLEVEWLGKGRAVVHNYGHGGAGVTLSWGCAAEVVVLAKQAQGGNG